MTLQKLPLPNALLVDLFRNSLVRVGNQAAQDALEMEGARPYRYLGGNQKSACLIISSPDSFSVPEKHLAFLVKILEACRMNLADVAILNHASHPVEIQALKEQLNPTRLVLFGLEPRDIRLPFHSPQFKIQEYDGCQYLSAPSMDNLNQDGEEGKILKSKLWVCLRKLFDI